MDKNKIKKFIKASSILITTCFLSLYTKSIAFAMVAPDKTLNNGTTSSAETSISSETIFSFLSDNQEYLQFFDVFSWIGHTLGWLVVKFLYSCSAGLEKFIDIMFDLFGIGTSGLATSMDKLFGIHNLDKAYNYIKIAGFTILGICLIVFAIKYMASDKLDLKDTTIRILLAVTLIASCNIFISYSMTGGRMFFDGSKQLFNTATKDQSYALNIINNNTVDVYRLAKSHQPLTSLKSHKLKESSDYIYPKSDDKIVAFKNKEEFMRADYTSVLNNNNEALWEKIGKQNEDLLSKYLINSDSNKAEDNLSDMKNAIIFKSLENGYFRYGVHFFDTIVQLLIFIVATILTIFVLARHIFNMIVLYIITPLVVSSDISTGTKMKRIALDILKGGGAIACTGLSYSIFLALFDKIMANDMNILLQLMLMLASAVALFDGAHAFNKYFDYDTGFKDGYKTLRGAQETIKTAKGAGSVVKSSFDLVKDKSSQFVNGFGSNSSNATDGTANAKFDEMDLENPFDIQNNTSDKSSDKNENNANSSINEDQQNSDMDKSQDSNMMNNESNNESNSQTDDLSESNNMSDIPMDDDNVNSYDNAGNEELDNVNMDNSINEDEILTNDNINDADISDDDIYSNNQNDNIDINENSSNIEENDSFVNQNNVEENSLESNSFDNENTSSGLENSTSEYDNPNKLIAPESYSTDSSENPINHNNDNVDSNVNVNETTESINLNSSSSDISNPTISNVSNTNDLNSVNNSINTSETGLSNNKPHSKSYQSYQIGSQQIDTTTSNYSSNESKYTQPNLKNDNSEW